MLIPWVPAQDQKMAQKIRKDRQAHRLPALSTDDLLKEVAKVRKLENENQDAEV